MYKLMVPLFALIISFNTYAAKHYGTRLCSHPNYHCLTIQKNQSWLTLFPDERQRDIVQRVNRINIELRAGMQLAIPDNLARIDVLDVAPFAKQVPPLGKNNIIVNMKDLAWGAYNSQGELVKWGPMSGGKNYCADVKRGCRTVTGDFTFYRKHGGGCKSSKYPIGKGGAPMPWCMFFHRGFAIHGSNTLPGYHASHGCVRVYPRDAHWLNTEFVKTGQTKIKIIP